MQHKLMHWGNDTIAAVNRTLITENDWDVVKLVK